MQRLRPRTRIDLLANEQRTSPIRWGRRVYFAILAGMGLLALDWAVGDAVVLRADGLVVAERSVAGTTYVARVSKVLVREGQPVAAGDVVVELESPEMLSDIARVASQNADLAAREVQQRTRVVALGTLLPLAERHAQESEAVVAKLDHLTGNGLVSSQRFDQALAAQYDAASRLAQLRAEAATLASELPATEAARRRANDTLLQLEQAYDRGRIRAARDGIVGARVPAPGQVVRVGDELLQIYGRETSVLAYLPDAYLFALHPGDRVALSGGQVRAEGVVDALLSVTDALPPEFQNTFRPRDRSRLVRIRLAGERTLAISQKIQVRGCMLDRCSGGDLLTELAAATWRLLQPTATAAPTGP